MPPSELAFFAVLALLWFGVWGRLGYLAGRPRGRQVVGSVLGVVLGLVGVLLALVLRPTVEAEARRRIAVEREMQRIRRSSDGDQAEDRST